MKTRLIASAAQLGARWLSFACEFQLPSRILLAVPSLCLVFGCSADRTRHEDSLPPLLPVSSDKVAMAYFGEIAAIPSAASTHTNAEIVSHDGLAVADLFEQPAMTLRWSPGGSTSPPLLQLQRPSGQTMQLTNAVGDCRRIFRPHFVRLRANIGVVFTGVRSLGDRPELYVFTIGATSAVKVASGDLMSVSPDRQRIAFFSMDGRDRQTIYLWHSSSNTICRVTRLSHADPFSGSWRQYGWTRDSQGFLIEGTTSGYHDQPKGSAKYVKLLYVIPQRTLYDCSGSD